MGKVTSEFIQSAIHKLNATHIKEDTEEVLEESFEEYEESIEDDVLFASSLPGVNLSKLSIDEKNQLRVSDTSIFSDKTWILGDNNKASIINFSSNRVSESSWDFIRTLLYYSIPENHPTGKIKSYKTASAYLNYSSLLCFYLFDENKINNLANEITNITLDQINRSFELAKKQSYSHYNGLLYIYNLWLLASEYNLLPKEYELKIPRAKILSKERLKDIYEKAKSDCIGWKPLDESELTELVKYIFSYTDNFPEHLHRLIDHYNQYGTDEAFFNLAKLDDKTSSLTNRLDRPKMFLKSIVKDYRDATIILIALITGLRRSELLDLNFTDFIKVSDDLCELDIRRFKTSNDPNFKGTDDKIFIPLVIFYSIESLRTATQKLYGETPTNLVYSINNPKIKLKSIGSIVQSINEQLNINLHSHRLRKTIASLLIMQNEKNIELIRFLFGHESYTMSMSYIMRNPYIINDVTNLMEHHYCEEFSDLISNIINGTYSGKAAENIANNIKKNSSQFKGDVIHATIKEFVHAMMESGEPLFIHKIPLGGTCISVPVLSSKSTPCTKNMTFIDRVKPDISMCEGELCPKAAFVPSSIPPLELNIKFYEAMLDKASEQSDKATFAKYKRLINATRDHIENITTPKPVLIDIAEVSND